MTLRHFRIFIAVATTGSVTQAARDLYISQPTVSVALRELEEHYGTRLFERINQRLKITEDGEAFLGYVSHLMTMFDDMERAFQNPEVHGMLRLGASVTVGIAQMADIVRAFSDLYPDVKVHVEVNTAEEIEKGILSNELDLALIEGAVHSGHIQSSVVFYQEHAAVCAPEHPMANRGSVTMEEFVKEPLLFRSRNSTAADVFGAYVLKSGYHIESAWESSTLEALVQAARRNLGIALLPEKMVSEDLASGRLCRIRIENFHLRSKVFLAYYKNKFLSPAIESFITFVTETWPDLVSPPEPVPED